MSDRAFQIALSSALAPFVAVLYVAIWRGIKWCALRLWLLVKQSYSRCRAHSRRGASGPARQKRQHP